MDVIRILNWNYCIKTTEIILEKAVDEGNTELRRSGISYSL